MVTEPRVMELPSYANTMFTSGMKAAVPEVGSSLYPRMGSTLQANANEACTN